MATKELFNPPKIDKELCIIVMGHAGSMSIGLGGGQIVVIPPEDPTWGSIIAKTYAAAAITKVEGPESPAARKFAQEAIAEVNKVIATKSALVSKYLPATAGETRSAAHNSVGDDPVSLPYESP